MKKFISLMMVLMLVLSVFASCKKTDEGEEKKETKQSEEKKETKEDTSKEDKKEDKQEDNADVPTLKWYTVGSGMPENYASWQKQVNDYIVPKIGAKVDVEVISWGDWDTRRNVIITSGEEFDIIFGNSGTFSKDITLGALADITSEVKGSKLTELIPNDYWRAVTVDEKVYGVPTYKDSSMTNYFVWDKSILDKYEVKDFEKIGSFKDAEPILKKVADGEGRPSYPMEKRGAYQILDVYDGIGLGLAPVGVRYDDKEAKVVNALKQADVMEELKAVRKMYEEGVINSDAFTVTENTPAGMICQVAQGWPMAAETVWGPQRGCEAVVSRFSPTMLTNDSVLGSINSVSVNSKNKDKAIALLELINTDSKLRDLFYYGEEGVDFEYKDGKINRLKEDWKMAGYTQGTFFAVTPLVGVEKNQWDEVKELNANAEPSVLLGFQLDITPIEAEIANVNQLWETYSPELLTGAKDPETAVEELSVQLDAAGLQTIIEECQKQVNEFLKK